MPVSRIVTLTNAGQTSLGTFLKRCKMEKIVKETKVESFENKY